jgi:hypothetical protein
MELPAPPTPSAYSDLHPTDLTPLDDLAAGNTTLFDAGKTFAYRYRDHTTVSLRSGGRQYTVSFGHNGTLQRASVRVGDEDIGTWDVSRYTPAPQWASNLGDLARQHLPHAEVTEPLGMHPDLSAPVR